MSCARKFGSGAPGVRAMPFTTAPEDCTGPARNTLPYNVGAAEITCGARLTREMTSRQSAMP